MFKIQPLQNLDELSTSLSSSLRRHVFCQKYPDCSDLYLMIKRKLGGGFTHPQNYPDLHQFRLADMYTRVSTVPRERESPHFLHCAWQHSKTPYCYGCLWNGGWLQRHSGYHTLGCSKWYWTVCPGDRKGRSWWFPGKLAVLQKGKIGQHVSEAIKSYNENSSSCRRKLLLKDFLLYTDEWVKKRKFCDICTVSCTCSTCSSM